MKNREYYDAYQAEIAAIREKGQRPSLLLHVCCAVCACDILTYLSEIFDITVYYMNDNIYPKEEYDHRLSELKRYLEWYHKNYANPIHLVEASYDNAGYMKEMQGYLDLPEFSARCWNCYEYRLVRTFAYASEHSFDYVATVMSVSRYKNAARINEIGEKLQKDYPNVKYLITDFKKDQGEQRSNALAKELDLYRQPYCGCANSLREYLARKESSGLI